MSVKGKVIMLTLEASPIITDNLQTVGINNCLLHKTHKINVLCQTHVHQSIILTFHL